jgi:hypothetical protein
LEINFLDSFKIFNNLWRIHLCILYHLKRCFECHANQTISFCFHCFRNRLIASRNLKNNGYFFETKGFLEIPLTKFVDVKQLTKFKKKYWGQELNLLRLNHHSERIKDSLHFKQQKKLKKFQFSSIDHSEKKEEKIEELKEEMVYLPELESRLNKIFDEKGFNQEKIILPVQLKRCLAGKTDPKDLEKLAHEFLIKYDSSTFEASDMKLETKKEFLKSWIEANDDHIKIDQMVSLIGERNRVNLDPIILKDPIFMDTQSDWDDEDVSDKTFQGKQLSVEKSYSLRKRKNVESPSPNKKLKE